LRCNLLLVNNDGLLQWEGANPPIVIYGGQLMPGSWEYEPPLCYVAILTRGTVPVKWARSLRELVLPNSTIGFIAGMPFDHARNTAVETVLKNNFKWLLFLDDDVIAPPNVLETLTRHELDIVSGLYYRRNIPITPVMMREGIPPSYITDFTPGSLIEADLVGCGCLLIHRRVLETVPSPWFEWRLDRKDLPENEKCSEDFAFCRNAKKSGFKIYVDTSVSCEHAGYAGSRNGRFEPLEI